jgi:hypothetical protein
MKTRTPGAGTRSHVFGALAIALVIASISIPAQASLVGALPATSGGTDYQLVNDGDRGITLLANANLAATNTFGVSGIAPSGAMNWSTANAWIAAMNASNGGAGYLGFNDWRLPKTPLIDPSCADQHGGGFSSGINCTGSELGHLFYTELGGSALSPISASSDPDKALFTNLQDDGYWAGDYDSSFAWVFNNGFGMQGPDQKVIGYFVVPVRDTVPVPGAAWLFGGALAALARFRRKSRA